MKTTKLISNLLRFFMLFLSDETGNVDLGLGGDGGGEAPPADGGSGGEAPPADGGAGGEAPPASIHGDLKVEWPEGTADEFKEMPSLKHFVKEDGKLDFANVLKSYVHANRMVGKDKLVIPGENATDEEISAYHTKLGWESNPENYQVKYGPTDENPEAVTNLEDEFVQDLTQFAYENKVPMSTAQKMVEFMEEQAGKGVEIDSTAQAETIKGYEESLVKEWGQAAPAKMQLAKRLIAEVVDDEGVNEALKDPMISKNPDIVRAFVKIADKLYSEDGFQGDNNSQLVSPEEAQRQIDAVFGDLNHPYHNRNHPNHEKATKDMTKLFEARG